MNQFSIKATGSTRYTLSKKDFEETEVRIPASLDEQNEIAQILSDMDTANRNPGKEIGEIQTDKAGHDVEFVNWENKVGRAWLIKTFKFATAQQSF